MCFSSNVYEPKVYHVDANLKVSSLVRIFENDDFIVDYDKERRMYRVSVFDDFHYWDECWFNEYKDNEKEAKDVTNVVYCKNCQYHRFELEPCHSRSEHFCMLLDKDVNKDFYCAFGKLK